MQNYDWNYEVIQECNDENENPTCWGGTDPAGNFWWIDKTTEGYDCMTELYGMIQTVKSVKSIAKAKRWISINWQEYIHKRHRKE